jgi:hypothetical protein
MDNGLIVDCWRCGNTHTKGYHDTADARLVEALAARAMPTPARGQPMPQTREYWEKRAAMDQELILEQKDEISRLKHTVNQLRQSK